jgi:hypothetical protein
MGEDRLKNAVDGNRGAILRSGLQTKATWARCYRASRGLNKAAAAALQLELVPGPAQIASLWAEPLSTRLAQ